MCDGVALLTWQTDTFAYAEGYDEGAARYPGLRGGQVVSLSADDVGLLVRPDAARRQMDAEAAVAAPASLLGGAPGGETSTGVLRGWEGTTDAGTTGAALDETPFAAPLPRRFYGTAQLDPARVGRDASRIADEVLAHLTGQVGAEVSVTLEIDVYLPDGASQQIVRTVTENSRTLKFASHGFEDE